MQAPRPLHRLRRAVWYLTAAVVILGAVLLTLTRVLLPSLESYRSKVEQVASEAIGQPVRIKTLNARLFGLSPTVVLEDVRLLDRKGKQTVARFGEARIGLDLLASLRERQPVAAELTVVGADLTVLRRRDGSVRVEGLAEQGTSNGAPPVEGIGRWLLAQGRLAIVDSALHLRDEKTGRELSLQQVGIELRNVDQRHQLNVEITPPPTVGRSIRLAFDLQGDLLRADGWGGEGYLQAQGVRPAVVWDSVAPSCGAQVADGTVDLQLWGSWRNGQLSEASAQMRADGLQLSQGKGTLALRQATADVEWTRQPDGWLLRVGDLKLQHGDEQVEPIQAWARQDAAGLAVQLSSARLDDAAALLPFAPNLPEAQRAQLAGLQPHGLVRQLRLDLPTGGAPHAQGILERVGVQAWERIPGFSGVSGRFSWQGDDGQLLFDSRGVEADLPHLFRAPLNFEQLHGSVEVHRSAAGWRIDAHELRASNQDIYTLLDASALVPAAGVPFLDLRGQFWNGRAASVPRYLPAHIMGDEAVAWLDNAFRDGTVTSGGVLFHGPLNAFPFDNGEGRFEVAFRTHDAELFFRDGWPTIKHLDAQVRFLNRHMLISASNGTMFDSRIQQADVGIDDLLHARLTVRGHARLLGDDALRLLRDTPLRDHLGNYVGGLQLAGESDLDLDLGIPLSSEVAQTQPFSVGGSVTFNGNRLLVEGDFPIEALEGQLRFSESGMQADELRARILGEPATVSIFSDGKGDAARTVVVGRGEMQVAALRQYSGVALLDRLSGRAQWQGALTVPHAGGGTNLRLLSDLEGIAVGLPEPLGKTEMVKRPLELVRYFSGPRAGQLSVRYGDAASLLLAVRPDRGIRRGTLRFGPGQARLPGRNVMRLSGTLRDVQPALWGEALQGDSKTPSLKLPLFIDMDELQLAADKGNTGGAGGHSGDWQQLPSLDVDIKRFGYGSVQLERLAFHLENSRDALQIQNLLLTGPSLKLTGQVRWQWRPRSYSEVKLQLESDDIGKLARNLHVASVVTRGKAQGEGEFHWPGPLTDADLNGLGGTLHVKVENGVIDEVDPGAGRLLGLLSLQALPRRLTLDFSDLFQKGLAFNTIEGDTNIRAGNAYTSNTTIDAPSAQIKIVGRTGLARRDYDQLITVVPNISGSAPVVGALAFGPQVGAVVLLFQKLLGKKFDQAAKIEYKVTGSWDKPDIVRLEPPKKSSDNSGTSTSSNPLGTL